MKTHLKPAIEKKKTVTVSDMEFEVIGQVYNEPINKTQGGDVFFTCFHVINVTKGAIHDRFYISPVLTEKELALNVEEAAKNIQP
jgi:hypothetical protein